MTKPKTVDEYLATFPEAEAKHLRKIRKLCRSAVPSAQEQIKWGAPAYVHPGGVILFMFSGHKKHLSVVFTPSTREAFDTELAEFETGKGSVALPYGTKVPEDLLRKMMKYRLREHEVDGVNWM